MVEEKGRFKSANVTDWVDPCTIPVEKMCLDDPGAGRGRRRSMSDPENAALSLVRGGPVWRLQLRLGLLGKDGLPTWPGAATVALFCWLPMAMLAGLDSRNWDLAYTHSFFTDLEAYSRFLVAPFILMITDRATDQRLTRLLIAFEDAGLVSQDMHRDYFERVARADQRTSSVAAEVLMLSAALLLAVLSTYLVLHNGIERWNSALAGLGGPLSPAGWWKTLVAGPLYYLLTLRWLWRLVVWTLLMKEISALPLRLVATHPDKAGGLGFLTVFPAMFVPLIFATSMVFATSELQIILIQGGQAVDLEYAVFGWLILVLIIFVGPLGFFTPALLRLKETALMKYGAIAAGTNRAAERRLADEFEAGQPIDNDIVSMMADISAGLETIKSLKPIPVEIFSLIPVVVSALVPLLAVAAVKFPVGSMLWTLFTSLL